MNTNSHNEWLAFAWRDKSSADYLQSMHPVPIEIVCYHYQQATEKALKGYLASKNIDPPRTHSLSLLCEMCGEFHPLVLELKALCSKLTAYATNAKYPNENELFIEDMYFAKQCAEKTMETIGKLLDFEREEEPDEAHEPEL